MDDKKIQDKIDEFEEAERNICIKRLQNADEFISRAINSEVSNAIHNTIINAISLLKRRI